MTSMDEQVQINIDTEVELYPVLMITQALGDGRYAIPRALLDALTAAEEAVHTAEAAIMEHVGAADPEAQDIAEWLHEEANEPKFRAAQDAYAADHPDGPDWMMADFDTRKRYLDAAGYELAMRC